MSDHDLPTTPGPVDQLDSAIDQYCSFQREMDLEFPRFTFSSFLRFFESDQRLDKPIRIVATKMPHRDNSIISIEPGVIKIFVSDKLKHATAVDLDSDRLRALIAHEIGHLVYKHAELVGSILNVKNGSIGWIGSKPDEEVTKNVEEAVRRKVLPTKLTP